MTLAQDGDVIEGTGYYAYGKQRELLSASQTGSETPAREKFTGKELDKEGMGCQVSLDIHLYNGSFNPYVLGVFKIFFTDGDSSVHLMDVSGTDLHLTRDIPFYQARTVDKLYLLVSNITPAISYKLDIANQELALGEKLSVAMSRDLPTQPLPNDPNLIDGVAHPELNYYTIGKSDGAETGVGLVYFGKRYYDQEVGVWTVVDPVMEFWTGYRYSVNPVAFVDPDGLATVRVAIYCNTTGYEFDGTGCQPLANSGPSHDAYVAQLQAARPGEDVQVGVFGPTTRSQMTRFLNEAGDATGDTKVIVSHGTEGSEKITDDACADEGEGHDITYGKLNQNNKGGKLGVSACNSGYNLGAAHAKGEYGDLEGVPGTDKPGEAGEVDVFGAAKEYVASKKVKEAPGETKGAAAGSPTGTRETGTDDPDDQGSPDGGSDPTTATSTSTTTSNTTTTPTTSDPEDTDEEDMDL